MRYGSSICWGLILLLGCLNAAADDQVRKRFEPILNWLPADSESLTVVDCPWQIPAEYNPKNPDEGMRQFDVCLRDWQLQYMLNGDQRRLLAGKTIRLWISAASDFHVESPPVQVEELIVPDGYTLRYTGVHIIEFDADSGFVASELFTSLLKTSARGSFPAAKRLDVLGYDTVEYSAMHMAENRPQGARETAATAPLIDVWFAFRFWMASPKPNILIVATSKEVLEATLNGIAKPSSAAFPVDAPEWTDIDPEAKVFGIRRFLRPVNASDYSDLRRFGAEASAFTFTIDNSASTANISIRRANPQARRRLEGILSPYVANSFRQMTSTPDVFQIQLNWADSEGVRKDRTPSGLNSVLLHWLGYSAII